jgi:hypothetical protein
MHAPVDPIASRETVHLIVADVRDVRERVRQRVGDIREQVIDATLPRTIALGVAWYSQHDRRIRTSTANVAPELHSSSV